MSRQPGQVMKTPKREKWREKERGRGRKIQREESECVDEKGGDLGCSWDMGVGVVVGHAGEEEEGGMVHSRGFSRRLGRH